MKAMYCMLRGTVPSTVEFEHETVYSVDIFQGIYSVGTIGKRMSKGGFDENFFQCQADGSALPSESEVKETKSEYLKQLAAERANAEDVVNNPSHYKSKTGLESIHVIDAFDLNFNLGNAVKYILRAGRKDPAKIKEDLNKAIWYLTHEVDRL